MRRVDDDFGQQELVLLYIAKRLKEATTLEEHLTAAGIDYLVECDTYRGGLIFVTERVGAFFYVTDADAGPARQVLARHNYRPYEAAV